MEIFKQDQYKPMGFELQAIVFYAVSNGFVDAVPSEKVREWEKGLIEFISASHAKLLNAIVEKPELTPEIEQSIKDVLEEYTKMSA